jgi:hypothetical protein
MRRPNGMPEHMSPGGYPSAYAPMNGMGDAELEESGYNPHEKVSLFMHFQYSITGLREDPASAINPVWRVRILS